MGYYRGMYGGVTPVQSELARTGDILSSGLAAAGQNALKKEQWATQKALSEAQLTRQAEMDKLQRPIYQRQANEAKLQMEQENQPLSVGTLFPDHWALTHASYVPSGSDKSLAEKVGDMFGAKIDIDEKSPTYGKYVKGDGTPVTFKDARTNAKSVQALILANTDPIQAASDMQGRYTEKLAAIQAKDPELTSPEAQKAIKNLKASSKWLDDPKMQLRTLEKQRDMLMKFEGPEFEKATARIDAQIKDIRELAKAQATKEFDIAKLQYQEEGKNKRAEASNATRLKAADKVAGAKEKKLTTQQAAEVKTLQSEYNSNLRVIEAYRKGEEGVTPEKASAARRNNVDIAKKLKKIGLPDKEEGKQNLDPLGLFDEEEEE